MSPIVRTVSCKVPPSMWACIDSGSTGAFCINKTILLHSVIKWCHNINILTDLESTHHGLSSEVLLHNMGPSISIVKVKANQPPKQFSWVVDHRLHSHQVWSWSDLKCCEIEGFCDPHGLAQFWIWPWPWLFDVMITKPLVLTYVNDDDLYRWKTKKLL
jgi:hypothetical protein